MNESRNKGESLFLVCCAALVFWFGGLQAAVAQGEVPAELPAVDLEQLTPEGRRLVGAALERFAQSRGTAEGEALGEAYGRVGLVLQAWQLGEAASVAYANAVRLDPGNAHWPYYLGVHYEGTGDYERALAYYRDARRLDEQYPNTLLRIGDTALRAELTDEAEAAYSQVLERHPELSPAALAGLGLAAFKAERYADAIDRYRRAVALAPEANGLHLLLAQAYQAAGDEEQAAEHRALGGQRMAVASDTRVEMMKARRYDSGYYVQQGVQAVQQGQMDRALQTFMLAMAINPDDADAVARMALALGFGEKREESVALIEQALEMDPDHGLANSLKGALLAEQGKFDEAQGFYFRAVSAEPGNIEFKRQFANGLMRLGDYDAAIRQYAEAIEMQPRDLRARYSQSVALVLADRCAQAMTVISEAVELNPRVALMLNARARIYATCPSATDAQRQQALEDATLLYEERPDRTHSETLAMALAANGRFEEAMDLQGQAIFEAIKSGDTSSQAILRENMQRYEAMLMPDAAWVKEEGT